MKPISPECDWIGSLSGRLTIPVCTVSGEEYTGEYEITPKAFEDQTLETSGKVLTNNLVVLKVPYYEVSNSSTGNTVYIAEEV